jgi:hypothetical protein
VRSARTSSASTPDARSPRRTWTARSPRFARSEVRRHGLTDLDARLYADEPFGRWTAEENGERRWVEFEPTDADRASRASWRPEPGHVDSFDHLLQTRLGTLDIVPEIAGHYGELRERATAVEVDGRAVWVESAADQLATLTVPRREKDRDRVAGLRAIQRTSASRKT